MYNVIVRQLGNGGAFDYDQTNTAFTLFDDIYLVDCGYNVFQKLMTTVDEYCIRLADKIKCIFITHLHEDHIGNLMTYLYWVEFVRKEKVYLFVSQNVYNNYVKYLFDRGIYKYNSNLQSFSHIEIHEFRVSPYGDVKNPFNGIKIRALTHRSHGQFLNTTYIFIEKNIKILISGDTKANESIEKVLLEPECGERYNMYQMLVFHDKSNWLHPDNIHATEYDINAVYSDKFKDLIIPVHTGDEKFKEIYKYEDLKTVAI